MRRKKATDFLKTAQKTLNLRFIKPAYLHSALAHPSYRHEHPVSGLSDFDRLEFFGDSILNLAVCIKLYASFPKASEGLLSRLRSILVSRKVLSRVAKEIKLHQVLLLPRYLKDQSIEFKSKILADSLEAVIAAVYLDQGFSAAQKFILRHLGPYMNAQRLFRLDPNPKSTLQEISQKNWQILPVYQHILIPGGVKVTVSVGRSRKASAVGRTHRDGEEKAARLLIRKIRQAALVRSRKRVSSGKKLRRTL